MFSKAFAVNPVLEFRFALWKTASAASGCLLPRWGHGRKQSSTLLENTLQISRKLANALSRAVALEARLCYRLQGVTRSVRWPGALTRQFLMQIAFDEV